MTKFVNYSDIITVFKDLKRIAENTTPIFYIPPPELLPNIFYSYSLSSNFKNLSKLVDSCPLCDNSRYEVWIGYSDFSQPQLPNSVCNFDPIVGYNSLSPFLVPFSLDNSNSKLILNLIYKKVFSKLVSLTGNCKECSQMLHIECVRNSISGIIPLIYQRDSDKKGNREASGLLFPKAIISIDFLLCPDCSFFQISKLTSNPASSPVVCSRCWRYFPSLASLTKISARCLGDEKKELLFEFVCNDCIVCSHCRFSSQEDNHHSSLGLPKKNANAFWMSLWIFFSPPLSLLLCGGCSSALDAKEYCLICCQLYEFSNFSIPMANCDVCDRWIHIECDPLLDLSWYIKVSDEKNGNTKYECPRCRKRNLITNNDNLVVNNFDNLPSSTAILKKSYFPTGTWILERGIIPYSTTPHLNRKWVIHENSIWPLGLVAARFVPSFRNPGRKTLLLVKVISGWEPSGVSPEVEILFLDDYGDANKVKNGNSSTASPHSYRLSKVAEWDSLWLNLWLKWAGHQPPPFIHTHSLSQLLGLAINDPKYRELAYRSSLPYKTSLCSRLTPFQKRKQVSGYGHSRFAISGNEVDCIGASILVIERSPIQGLGVFSKSFILVNKPLLAYYGVIIGPHVADNLEFLYDTLGLGCYFFKLSPSLIIDATLGGSVARFVNHSCDPNCVAKSMCSAKKLLNRSTKRLSTCTSNCDPNCSIVVIYSKRHIKPREELTYDYKFKIECDPSRRIPCGCRSLNCRQFMN